MAPRRKLNFLTLPSMLLLLPVAAYADADTLSDAPANCVDLKADCSTLMVNYAGESVRFALFRRESVNADSSSPDSDAQLLAMDFLRGLQGSNEDPAFAGGLPAVQVAPSGADVMHDWALAAASSVDRRLRQFNSENIPLPGQLEESSPTFWDLDYVYQWEVDVNVLDSGNYDISQVALSDIYLSPKISSTSDPEIVVCEINDSTNCRSLAE